MPNYRKSSENNQDARANHKPIWRPYLVIAGAAIVGLSVIWALCFKFIPLEKDRLLAFIGFVVNYLILMAMFVQAYITNRQWIAMREGLDKTQRLIEQNESVIEAATRQANSATAQSAMMREGLQQNRELFELADRPSLGIEKIAIEKYADGTGRIVAIARNSGKSPAIKFKCSITLNFRDPSEVLNKPCPEPKEIDPPTEDPSFGVCPVNAPITIMSPVRPDHIIESLEKGHIFVMVWVRGTYESIHGREYSFEYYARFNSIVGAQICGTHNDAD